jgi:UDP-N-acetylglucosamine enolpyruvyl transferase
MQCHTPQVLVQQTDNLGPAQVIYADVHMSLSLVLLALT